MKIKRDIQ